MLRLFKKDLGDALKETKTVNIQGVSFKIKKIDAFDFMDGSKSVLQLHETYRAKGNAEGSSKKIKEHYRDVIMSGVVSPKLARKEEDEGVLIDDLLSNWAMSEELYKGIIEYTYSKKKSIFGSFLGRGF